MESMICKMEFKKSTWEVDMFSIINSVSSQNVCAAPQQLFLKKSQGACQSSVQNGGYYVVKYEVWSSYKSEIGTFQL